MWGEWLICLCALCAAASLGDLMLPKGALKGAVRAIEGLLLLDVMLGFIESLPLAL